MILTKLRSNLDPDTLDEIIFLNKNLKHDLKNNVCQNLEPLQAFPMPDPPVSDTNATTQQEKATVKKELVHESSTSTLPKLPALPSLD